MAQLRAIEGDAEGALDLLDEAAQRYVSDFFPNVRPIAAMKARILIKEGRLAEAERWRSEAGVTPEDPLNYLREFEHITLARLLLAQGEQHADVALELLSRLVIAAEEGARMGRVLEISILQAVALQGNVDAALGHLGRALAIAEPEGFVRAFLDEGEPMTALLATAAKRGISPAFTRMLLAEVRPPGDAPVTIAKAGLIEPLSERELDVLRLLRTELDGPQIARELNVSLNTMRTHTKNIYEKLGVNNRRAAVRRADELMLVRNPPR
jgi:LuxR family transcriptional regulator, maltose regulon positive regulatory protein